MRKFTVKDFITYNNPCFSCGNPVNFRFRFVGKVESELPRPLVTPNYTEIDLTIKYSKMEALKLCIFHKTNKILTNSLTGLTKYLSENKLFLSSRCDRCNTQIESRFLEINVDKGYVAAVGLSTERLIVTTNDRIFQVVSSFMEEKSTIYVDRLDQAKPTQPFTLELPLIPKYKFKNRENFLSKIKTYMIFS